MCTLRSIIEGGGGGGGNSRGDWKKIPKSNSRGRGFGIVGERVEETELPFKLFFSLLKLQF